MPYFLRLLSSAALLHTPKGGNRTNPKAINNIQKNQGRLSEQVANDFAPFLTFAGHKHSISGLNPNPSFFVCKLFIFRLNDVPD